MGPLFFIFRILLYFFSIINKEKEITTSTEKVVIVNYRF
jgi:hypothetical protein